MRTDHTHYNTPWIDLFMPTEQEINEITQEYDLPSGVVGALESSSAKDTARIYPDALFFILHFPAFQSSHKDGRNSQEIDFIITHDVFITVHYDTVDAIHNFSKLVRTAAAIGDDDQISHQPTQIMVQLLKKLYRSVYNEIEYVESWLDIIEENIFAGNERTMVYEISRANRRLLDARRIMHLHDNLMDTLAEGGEKLFGADLRAGIKKLRTEYRKLNETITGNITLVDEFRSTNNSLLSTKRNETMQSLTVLANITLPITMIAAIFSMNATGTMPIVGDHNDFWIILTLMITTILVMTLIFKYMKWF